MSSDYNKKYFLGFILALSAGLIWSFGAPTVRHMVDAQIYQWHYLFCRGLTVATILLIFLLYKEGLAFRHNFNRVGISGLLGGVALAFAFIFFIFGMTYTSAATTLFMIGTQPLFAGLFAYIFLREYVRAATLIACLISLGGMFIMAYNDWQSGTLLGWTFGLLCSISFATFAVTLRWQPDTPKFTTIMISGVVCALFSVLMIYFFVGEFSMPVRNILLSILHGSFVASGLILLSIGSNLNSSFGDRFTNIRKSIDLLKIEKIKINGLAHITGGGIIENLPRILDKKFQAQIDLDKWDLGNLYKWLISCGINQGELLKTFNAGYGMALIASKKDIKKVERIINKHEFTSSILGKIAHKKRASDKSLTLSGELNK